MAGNILIPCHQQRQHLKQCDSHDTNGLIASQHVWDWMYCTVQSTPYIEVLSTMIHPFPCWRCNSGMWHDMWQTGLWFDTDRCSFPPSPPPP